MTDAALPHVVVRRVADVVADLDLLDAVERARLRELAPGPVAAAYTALHVLARRVLAEVAGGSPKGWVVDRTCPTCGGQHGQPTVANRPDVWISLSRTAAHVAVAVSRTGPVGVDLEDVERFGTIDPSVVLHPDEQDGDCDYGDPVHLARAWTRKEACLKALGVGLRVEPASFVTPEPGHPWQLRPGSPLLLVRDHPVPWPGLSCATAVVAATTTPAVPREPAGA